jgi:chemotaxis family two-component system sensor kinase Cph1
MVSDSAAISDLLLQCGKEPIHIPGAVQPFGILLTVDTDDLRIRNISENAAALWRIPVSDLVGSSLSELLSAEDLDCVRQLVESELVEQQSLRVSLRLPHPDKVNEWELRAHYHLDSLYLELEPAPPALSLSVSNRFHTTIRDAVRALQSATGLQDLCDKAVHQVRKATGFDRVMIYRFDKDWHGVVTSEARSDEVAPYIGHHFPASDIPPQARAVFLQNWLRMIPDVDYTPSRVVPDRQRPDSDQPLDLGKTLLRSVSPVHLEYLRNMGVQATLTVSLIDDGELWGLIACHHATPLLTSSDQRIAAEMIGRLVSSQLRIKEELEDRQYREELGQTRVRVVDLLEAEADLATGLALHAPAMQEMTSAISGSIAVCYGNTWTRVGQTPPVAMLENLVSWLAESLPDQTVFETSHLSSYFPAAAEHKEIASGLLAMSISRSARDYVLWFRPEQSTTVTWAGAPSKPIRQTGDILTVHPRKSFDSWKEVVTGRAAAWKASEIAAVEALRHDIIALALKQEYAKEQEARLRAEQLSREKDEMVMMVSHDLKTPLNVIAMSYEFIRRFHPGKEPSVQRMVERGERAMHMMNKLITNILDVAKIEAGTLDLDLKSESAVSLSQEAVESCHPLAAEKAIELVAIDPPENCRVVCERYRILQVLNNLVSNAVKFTPRGGRVTISVHPRNSEVMFKVSDTGEGIPSENLQSIFERFWQAEEARHRGTGLGLWISKGIIERHNGRIWATSEPGVGSVFCFTLASACSGPSDAASSRLRTHSDEGDDRLHA